MHVASFAHPARNVMMFEIRPGSTVADFGAGSGHYALELARAVGESGRVYAIDVQPDLLRRITNEAGRAGLNTILTIVGDVSVPHGTKLRSRSVSMVLMSNILFQIEHKRATFEEAHRILEPGGHLAVIDWKDMARRLGPSRAHVYSRDEAIREAQSAHFHYIGDFPAGVHHYGLMFESA